MGFGRIMRNAYREDIQHKPDITRAMLLRISKLFLPYWKGQLLVVVLVALISALGLVPPLLVRQIIDTAVPHGDVTLLFWLTAASIGAALVLGLLTVAENYINTWIGKHVVLDLQNAMYQQLQRMGLRFFSETRTGDIISRINNDVSGVERVITGTIVQTLQSIAVVTFTLITLFAMDWRLSLVGVLLIPAFVLPTRRVGKARWTIAKQTQERLAELNQIIQETLGLAGSLLVKVFSREPEEQARFREVSSQVARLQIKESLVGRWFRMFIGVFTSIGPALIYFYGGYLVIQGELTIGTVVAFIALLSRLYGPAAQLFNIHIDVVRSLALFERVFQYLDMQPDIQDDAEAINLPPVRGQIEFDSVGFRYKPDQPVLENISFSVEPGEMAALVGPSGAGKTTATYLVPRLYDVDSGAVRIDGHDIRTVTTDSLRKQIGVVTQDTYLFNTTIRENILYAKPGATEAEMVEACRAAYIHNFIVALPSQYDTIVGERGIKLSGGEKQRIAIARAILKEPRITILDEATSSLDSHSEALIQAALEPLLKNRTNLVIAHRLSTIRAADKILVFDNGRIVEHGTHKELLARRGLYQKLHQEQFKTSQSEVSQL